PQVGLNVPSNDTNNNRSLGMGDGMIFTGMYGNVYAINAQTGAQVWATQVVNPIGGGGIDVSPVYYKGVVIIGTTGGDWGGACEAVALNARRARCCGTTRRFRRTRRRTAGTRGRPTAGTTAAARSGTCPRSTRRSAWSTSASASRCRSTG